MKYFIVHLKPYGSISHRSKVTKISKCYWKHSISTVSATAL